MTSKILATVACFALSAVPALAQEVDTPIAPPPANLPINPPPGAVVKSLGNLYIWGDGGAWAAQQKTQDPNTSQEASKTLGPDQMPLSPDMPLPTASSATTRGAIGYVLPSGTLSPKLGSNVRTEFGMSQTIANTPLTGGSGPLVYNGVALGSCSTCNSASADYDATELSAKAASDYKFDALTLTPSVTVFNSQSHQNFSGANATALEWRDIGAKAGVNAKIDLSKQVAFGVGGSYGRAMRDVSGSFDNAGLGGSTTPYLANGEAKLTYKAAEELSFNGYAGLSNYDNKVPGVASAGRVDYAPASNVYYGAGATYHFGTK
jgi:hypothetical protein